MEITNKRRHSKFSASGSERWFNCPGSVKLTENLPDKQSVWSQEGTQAHEVLEQLLKTIVTTRGKILTSSIKAPREMIEYGDKAANFIWSTHKKNQGSDLLVETRIYLDFIHPEMFGTFDSAVIDHFGTLHVFDYKYGIGHVVSPVNNLQMIFYGLGLAYKYDWNFKQVKLWIIQPRIKNYEGPVFWTLPIQELIKYVSIFKAAVDQVEDEPNTFKEGSWCHWCRGKGICPVKNGDKMKKAKLIFSPIR